VPAVHTDEVDGAVGAVGSKVAAHLAQEGRELVLGHLAAGHGELAMPDATVSGYMAVDRHILRRVGEDHLGPIPAEKQVIGVNVESAAAQQAVWTQRPEIVRARHRRRRHVGDVVFGAQQAS
jgi:hypothetical protein